MDIRILKEKLLAEEGKDTNTIACVDWAFAGRSRTTKDPTSGDGVGARSHTVWDHWIDSKGDDVPSDEGDMTVLEDGTVLEEGLNVHPKTGKETRYEELWRDIPVDLLGKKQSKHSIALRAEDPEQNIKGLVIKIGGWCQGIMHKDGKLTIERWQRKPELDDEADETYKINWDDPLRTRNNFVRTFKIGAERLYCREACGNTNGKIGMNRTQTYHGIEWRVIEEYYW